ncbi:rhodanese-like domain-containing protein [Isoptericola sp. b490]|uniref:rhodanese-like domain-containing protein n=1 Tax=Actinotalea lenta TaxID=3064654 RepID=UPI002712D981|nr:rhodanese-like domain-containing protein [Isoptericola sp. b490]MDO8120444.1 rhodanese-like domain-containing protein [Isoptericola sp. b490]
MLLRTRTTRVAAAAALGVALATGISGCAGDTPANGAHAELKDLPPQAFAERAATPGVVVLDVRTPQEFAAGHLPGAINVDVEAPDFATRIAQLDTSVPYAVYCHSGNRSAAAMQQMAAAGFTDLADLAGGITAWAQAGGTIVTG